jgi:hypothetical protein
MQYLITVARDIRTITSRYVPGKQSNLHLQVFLKQIDLLPHLQKDQKDHSWLQQMKSEQ